MARKAVGHNAPDFYVYEIVVDGICRYIGKGCGDRHKEHLRTTKKISRLRASGQTYRTSRLYNRLVRAYDGGSTIHTRIIAHFLRETAALVLERAEISKLPIEQRWNILDGGQGWTSEAVKARWLDPAYRARMAKRSKDNWLDHSFRNNQTRVRATPEYKSRASKALKDALANPDVRQTMSSAKVEAFSDPVAREAFRVRTLAGRLTPEGRANLAAAKRKQWADPVFRAAQSERYKKGWADPEKRKAHAKRALDRQTPERRDEARAKMISLWLDPEYRARQLASRNARKRSN